MNKYSKLLEARNIQYILFDSNADIIYPNVSMDPSIRLSQKEWEKLSKGESVTILHDIKRFEQEVSLVALPSMEGENITGGILLLSPISTSLKMIGQLNQYLLYTIAIAATAAIFLSLIFSRNLSTRVRAFRKATSMISSGDYNVNVPDDSKDDLGYLARDFNEMVVQLKNLKRKLKG